MLVKESGPFDVLVKLRELTGVTHYDDGSVESFSSYTPLGCVWCTSVWTSLLILALPKSVRRILAVSAIACIVEERYGKS